MSEMLRGVRRRFLFVTPIAFAAAAAALPGTAARGQTVVLPTPFAVDEASDNLTTPFRNAPRVLQMYFNRSDLGAFADGVDITGLQFRLDGIVPAVSTPTWPTADINFSRYDVQLSDSSAAAFAAGDLNSTTFADNIGPDVTTVRSGPLTVAANSFADDGSTSTGASFGFLVNFATPFRYEPGEDLVVTIRHTGFAETQEQPNFDATPFVDNRNDALAGTGSADATTGNFFGTNITQFTFTPIPEPGAGLALLATGALLMRRRRRRGC